MKIQNKIGIALASKCASCLALCVRLTSVYGQQFYALRCKDCPPEPTVDQLADSILQAVEAS